MRLRAALITLACLLAGCAGLPDAPREPDETRADPLLAGAGIAHAVVAEAFITAATPSDNIDSPAAWTAADGSTWLFATAKASGKLVIYDGDDGGMLRSWGMPGTGAGQLARPNGIFVHGDLAFVVERDNHRVQVLQLPSLRPLASFGENELLQPYGIWLHETAPGQLDVWVTDAYMAGEDAAGDSIVPPLADLGRRIQRYTLVRNGDAIDARHRAAIGDTRAAGAIRIPESLQGDPSENRVLVAEEDVATGTALREYDLDGRYRNRSIGVGTFKAQAEGIALWACPDGSGYWLATDQFKDRTLFHVYDRASLAHVGAFAGRTVANTDGIWLQQAATKAFPDGVLYAVHDDMAVAAFDWRAIAAALSLRVACTD